MSLPLSTPSDRYSLYAECAELKLDVMEYAYEQDDRIRLRLWYIAEAICEDAFPYIWPRIGWYLFDEQEEALVMKLDEMLDPVYSPEGNPVLDHEWWERMRGTCRSLMETMEKNGFPPYDG